MSELGYFMLGAGIVFLGSILCLGAVIFVYEQKARLNDVQTKHND